MLLLWLVWPLVTAALIAVALALGARDHSTTCVQEAALVCASPGQGHSPGSSLPDTTTGQAPRQRAAGIPQAGP
jgi:hypothetical protein